MARDLRVSLLFLRDEFVQHYFHQRPTQEITLPIITFLLFTSTCAIGFYFMFELILIVNIYYFYFNISISLTKVII